MSNKLLHQIATVAIFLVWLINGLFCKVLNLVPRHQEIVAQILGTDYARPLTVLIGISEIVMAAWVLSKFQSKWNAITQITIVMVMNVMELVLVPDLLLWGRFNIIFAMLFCALVYWNEFILKKNLMSQSA